MPRDPVPRITYGILTYHAPQRHPSGLDNLYGYINSGTSVWSERFIDCFWKLARKWYRFKKKCVSSKYVLTFQNNVVKYKKMFMNSKNDCKFDFFSKCFKCSKIQIIFTHKIWFQKMIRIRKVIVSYWFWNFKKCSRFF